MLTFHLVQWMSDMCQQHWIQPIGSLHVCPGDVTLADALAASCDSFLHFVHCFCVLVVCYSGQKDVQSEKKGTKITLRHSQLCSGL